MYRVGLRFYPNQANPARPSGRGVYRVVSTTHGSGYPWKPPHVIGPRLSDPLGQHSELWLSSVRPVKLGSRVDPLRMLLTGLKEAGNIPVPARYC